MKQTKRKKSSSILPMLSFAAIGAACGLLTVRYLEFAGAFELSIGRYLLLLGGLGLAVYLALFLQLTLHEAGHLLFGLLSGYRFTSFRIGSLIWVKEDGAVRLRRLTLAGTGGQCLMAPPEPVDGRFPYVLFNLGGVLVNLATVPLCVGARHLTRDLPLLPLFFQMLGVIGLGVALMNGIPLRMGMINNDGHNALSLGKSPAALRALWIQLTANALIAQGRRLLDMPEEWFALPSDEELQNSMTATLAVFRENRLMEAHLFDQALELIDILLDKETAIVCLHRSLLVCDRMYCELIGSGDHLAVESLRTKEQLQFMKQMRTFPSVLRTEYALALLHEKDQEKTERVQAEFEKCAKTYPYPADIQTERELIGLARRCAEET